MSHRKKKKKQRKRQAQISSSRRNLHHLLFQGRHWDYGYARLLRTSFVFSVQVYQHNLLHNEVLHDVPCPPEDVLAKAWRSYQAQREDVEHMNLLQSIGWLMSTVDDDEFRRAMVKQYCFFSLNGGW